MSGFTFFSHLTNRIKKILSGNRRAQSQFYDEYCGLVMGVCSRYMKNDETAADVFQDSFTKIFQSLNQVKDEKALAGWIKKTTVNTALNHLRSIKYHDEINDETLDLSDHYYAEMIDKLSSEAIIEVIDKLPEGYRVIFNLFAIDGFSHKEIANQLGINEGTSRSQLAHARKLLKKHLNELGITRYERVI